MSNIKENLKYLRAQRGINQSELAEALGIKRTALNAWEIGRASPRHETAKHIAAYFGVSPESLLFGSIKETNDASPGLGQGTANNVQVLAITVDNDDNENIELVNVKAFAGYAMGYGDPEFIKELPKFRLPFLSTGTYRAFEIDGDSMLPIASGSIVIGQYTESLGYVKPGDTYIFITQNSGILFKRVARIDKDKIFLQSDNPLYYSYSLPLSEIREVWKTKLYMSYQLPDPGSAALRMDIA